MSDARDACKGGALPDVQAPRAATPARVRHGELGPGAADFESEGRLDTEVGYGLALTRNRGLLTPYTALGFGEGANRIWRFGARWRASDNFRIGLEGTQEDNASDAPTNAVQRKAQLRWSTRKGPR